MASLAAIAGGALINALAFSGTNAAFSLLGYHGKAEMKRHNLAMEQLSQARDEYSRQRQQRLDYINKTLQDQRPAEQTFSDLGIARREYHEVTGNQLPPLKEPRLSDFYNPSRQRKDTEIALVVGGMTVVGALAYKFGK